MAETEAVLHDPFGHLELAGRQIAWIHGDKARLFHDVETSGHFDYLFYGHSHRAEQHQTGPTRVVNPGALHRAKVKTFVVLDLASGELQTVTVE
jgi:predicted phosphodiesterase